MHDDDDTHDDPTRAASDDPTRPPFPRTTCACPTCIEPCTRQPGSLAAGDLERIAAFLGKPLHAILARFWASPGALVGDSRTGRTFRIGTITPKLRAGRCVFLNSDDRCTIHPVAPIGCSHFDTHMDAAEGQRRAVWLTRSQATDAYQSLRRTLDVATSYRPTAHAQERS